MFLKYMLYVGCFTVNILNVVSQFKIIGGVNAVSGQFPYQASLRLKKLNMFFCGGSIISSSWLLTAAHCVFYEEMQNFSVQVVIVVGTNSLKEGGVFYDVVEYKLHDRFNAESRADDIALIRANESIPFSLLVKPITLASANIPDGSEAVLAGWGYTQYPAGETSPILQYMILSTIPLAECRQKLNETLTNNNICTYKTWRAGACKGDSGSPIAAIDTGLQIGVVSWGIPCAMSYPDVFTSVVPYRLWINDITGI